MFNDFVPLDKIKIYNDWKDAPVGAMLRMASKTLGEVVGVRCELEFPTSAQYLALIEDKNPGVLADSQDLDGPAMSMGECCELAAANPCPTKPQEQHEGALYCYDGQVFVMWCRAKGGITAWVSLAGAHHDFPHRGALKSKVNTALLVRIADSTAVRFKL